MLDAQTVIVELTVATKELEKNYGKRSELALQKKSAEATIEDIKAMGIIAGKAQEGKNDTERKKNFQEWLSSQCAYTSAQVDLKEADLALIEPSDNISLAAQKIHAYAAIADLLSAHKKGSSVAGL